MPPVHAVVEKSIKNAAVGNRFPSAPLSGRFDILWSGIVAIRKD